MGGNKKEEKDRIKTWRQIGQILICNSALLFQGLQAEGGGGERGGGEGGGGAVDCIVTVGGQRRQATQVASGGGTSGPPGLLRGAEGHSEYISNPSKKKPKKLSRRLIFRASHTSVISQESVSRSGSGLLL